MFLPAQLRASGRGMAVCNGSPAPRTESVPGFGPALSAMRGVIQFLSGTHLRLAIAAGPVSESPKRRRGASRNDCEIGQPNTDWEKADDGCKHGVLLRCTGCRPSRCHFGAGAWHALVTEMKSVLIGVSGQPAGTGCQYVPHRCT